MNLKRRFTLWYIRRGYTFGYDYTNLSPDYDCVIIPKAVWECPWWVKPLLIFFSPSIYSHEVWFKNFRLGLREGLKDAGIYD